MIRPKTPNSMEIAGQSTVTSYMPELSAFRGKFLGSPRYYDFVSDSIQGLQQEGEISLQEYLVDCHEAGIESCAHPEKMEIFALRYPESFSERLSSIAAEEQVSVNTWILEMLNERLKQA